VSSVENPEKRIKALENEDVQVMADIKTHEYGKRIERIKRIFKKSFGARILRA
jgi:hypothetical protein